MNFEPVIGLEIHVQMKTRSKMFSSSPNSFSHEPNTEVTPFDMAYPGTMPRVNKQAVINAIRVANALHMTIDPLVRFDRKNYFYSDLPKGFQITQQFHPIGSNGYLDILDEHGNTKRVRIERIHIEEDTCKQVHFPDCSLLDYNRAGTPLVEIVSMPDIASGTEAMHYVEAIRNIVVYSLTSDGKMEEGSLRCDVNVSLRPVGYKGFGTKPLKLSGYGNPFFQAIATIKAVTHVGFYDHGNLPGCTFHHLVHAQPHEVHSVVERATKAVPSLVGVWRQELAYQVSVAGMNLNAVKTCIYRQLDRRAEVFSHFMYLIDGHAMHKRRRIHVETARSRNRHSSRSRLVRHVPTVSKLYRHFGSFPVDGIGQRS